MKFTKNSLLGILAVGLACLLTYIFIHSADSVKVMEERPVVSSVVNNPGVPKTITFCGETIDLIRYNMYEAYDRETTSFTYLHSTTLLLLKKANRYFPVIEPILKEQGIPDDFKYLAVIESQLNPRVTSPTKAVGMWQLLEATAKENGLTVTPTVDERCDVEKSTYAACRYLKAAYAKYGNWSDVAASYNAGMGRITGELQKQQVDTYYDLWLVEETTRYVYRILAIKQIFENPYKFGFVLRAEDLYKPIECETVSVSSNIQDLAAFAKQQGVTYADLKRFNPWLRDRKLETAGKTYKMLIPKQSDMYYNTPNTYVHDARWVVK